MARIFQSVSPAHSQSELRGWKWMVVGSRIPSSMRATVPSTFTCRTSPLAHTRCPISHTSRGSLSPLACVLGSMWVGSSHVCEQGAWPHTHTHTHTHTHSHCNDSDLGQGTIVPYVAMVGEAVAHKPHLPLLHILLHGVQSYRHAHLQGRHIAEYNYTCYHVN